MFRFQKVSASIYILGMSKRLGWRKEKVDDEEEEYTAMFEKYIPVAGCTEISGAKEDRKAAKRIGQYRISEMALYYADGTYIPFADMSDIKVEKMTVPTKGCCGIVLETPALTFQAGGAKRRVMTDSEKQTQKIYEAVTGKPYET